MTTDAVKLAPSILAADFAHLGDQVEEAERAGADRIHVDVMDGHFVPNLSMGPPIINSLRRVTQLPLEAHLIISNPDVLNKAATVTRRLGRSFRLRFRIRMRIYVQTLVMIFMPLTSLQPTTSHAGSRPCLPFEYNCKAVLLSRIRSILNPLQQMLGLNR